MPDLIRLAKSEDAAQIAGIYAPIVRETAISFELEAPDEHEIADRVATTLRSLPWLVMVDGNKVLGYAYASAHRDRLAYQWSADVSAYVHAEAQRRGVGRRLYFALLAILGAQGYFNAYAGIALPNVASVGLHKALGFQLIAVYENVGYKAGEWRSVSWWGLVLREHAADPAPPKQVSALPAQELAKMLR